MHILADGSYAFRDRINVPGEGSGYFTFAEGWLIEIIAVEKGEYYFYSDGREIRPGDRRFGVYYPPFTIVRAFSGNIVGELFGIGSTQKPSDLPDTPAVFETERREPFGSIDEAAAAFTASPRKQTIEVNTRPSLLSLKAKRLIDENYRVFPSIAKIAVRLGVSHPHLSRQFKRDLGMSPSEYLHHLRVADATFLLSIGEEIVDISGEVGYNDLSRFYKQFKKSTGTSPAICRTILGR